MILHDNARPHMNTAPRSWAMLEHSNWGGGGGGGVGYKSHEQEPTPGHQLGLM
jgi:hypothetical protein